MVVRLQSSSSALGRFLPSGLRHKRKVAGRREADVPHPTQVVPTDGRWRFPKAVIRRLLGNFGLGWRADLGLSARAGRSAQEPT